MDSIKLIMKRNMRQYAMLVALIVITILFQVLTDGVLLKPINVHRLIQQNSYILILAVGMMLCILSGGHIDLSVGSIVALIGASSAVFSVILEIPVGLSILLSLLLGLLAGMWQGYWIAYMKIPSFIVTLAGMLVFRGISDLILNGETIALPQPYITLASGSIPDFFGGQGLHLTTVAIGFLCSLVYVGARYLDRRQKQRYSFKVPAFKQFMLQESVIFVLINLFTYWLALAKGMPYIVMILTVLILIYSFITNQTVAGRHIYAMGATQRRRSCPGSRPARCSSGCTPTWGSWPPWPASSSPGGSTRPPRGGAGL